MRSLLPLLLSFCACAIAGDTETATRSLLDDTPDAVGVLGLVNDIATTEAILDLDVPLDVRAARGLIAGRPFTSIDEIDAVSYVGPVALERLVAYAAARGYTPEGDDLLGTYDGVGFTVDEAERALGLVNEVSDGVLRFEVGLDIRAVTSIVEARPVATVRELSELYWVGGAMLERIKSFTAASVDRERADCRGNFSCEAGERCGGIPRDGSGELGLCYPIASIPGEGRECDADDECGEDLACNGISVGYGQCLPWWMHDQFENINQRFIGAETPTAVATSVVVRGQASVPMDVIVSADIRHSHPHNLRVVLRDPNGAEAVLWNGPHEGGSMPATFNAQGEISRDDEVNGRWLLQIFNDGGAGSGNIYGWTLDISSRFD